MASMLSIMSSVFSNNQADSVVSYSEDEYSQANGNNNPWEESNVNKSKIKQPKVNESAALKPYSTTLAREL